jgi:ribosomal protein S12 methylthiotransferase accessory factor
MEMTITLEGKAKVIAEYKGFKIITDQPLHGGGEGTAPAPFDLFLASIGTCAGIYVKSFCDQRGIPSHDIRIIQSMEPHPEKKGIGKITLRIEVPEAFPDKYLNALVHAADICAVKRHLADPPGIETSISKLP